MTATAVSTTATTNDSFLRLAMRADAVISGLTGVGLVLLAPRVAEMSGTTSAVEYATGAFFIVFSLAVLAMAARPNVRTWGLLLAVGNVLFTVATVAVVLADVWPLTTTGVALFLGTGVYTLVMADLQYLGVRRLR